tara:strand:- start:423 stop:1175 length:753 start_codon:yes stop_codon:yes gene_type:complete
VHKRPYLLSIAGLDPSGGAGLLADVKTFESLKCYGLAVNTANTIQNDIEIESCEWLSIEQIKSQIDILFHRFPIEYVKIGIVENWESLDKIIQHLFKKNENLKIILDPVLKSSSNFEFHPPKTEQLENILSKLFLICPNLNELKSLYPGINEKEACQRVSMFCHLYLKGGHRQKHIGKDELFTKDNSYFPLNPKKNMDFTEKHGSGCVFSSALSSYLALGFPLLKACFRAKRYTEKFLSSNPSFLGYHKL